MSCKCKSVISSLLKLSLKDGFPLGHNRVWILIVTEINKQTNKQKKITSRLKLQRSVPVWPPVLVQYKASVAPSLVVFANYIHCCIIFHMTGAVSQEDFTPKINMPFVIKKHNNRGILCIGMANAASNSKAKHYPLYVLRSVCVRKKKVLIREAMKQNVSGVNKKGMPLTKTHKGPNANFGPNQRKQTWFGASCGVSSESTTCSCRPKLLQLLPSSPAPRCPLPSLHPLSLLLLWLGLLRRLQEFFICPIMHLPLHFHSSIKTLKLPVSGNNQLVHN